MRSSDLRREENYSEYLRLRQNDDYYDVTFDEASGGVTAIHRSHKFDKKVGNLGIRRGDYELAVVDVLRKSGHRVVLESERSIQNRKVCDGYLDDVPTEIKAVEGTGTWSISTKLRDAVKQHAQSVILFFPKEDLYSEIRVKDGLRLFLSGANKADCQELNQIVVIVEDKLVSCIDQKTTPIKGWSIEEGLRGQNGATPFTIPPSDAKL
ncbi:MAG: hypothetical protein IJU27_07395 [Bacteroidales bacterium]|nr:hypothetical protein [Bacteroidales bacterium]